MRKRPGTAICTSLSAVLIALAMWVLIPVTALAATPRCTDWVAMIVSLEGRVESRFEGKGDWQPAVLNDRYCAEDELRTLENSRAALQLRNDTIVRLDQNSMVKFVAAEAEIPLLLRLLTGKAFFMTRFPRPLTIETPFVNAASGGTEYVIAVDEATGSVIVQVIEGTVNLDNPAGRLTLTEGQSSLIRSGEAPVPHLTVTPKDALQWALYYPPVLNLQDLRLEAMDEAEVPDWSMMVRASIERYQAGDAASALEAVSREPVGAVDPRFYAYRASLLLSVGRVEAASADLEQALTLAPESGLARALQSIIAVVQNEPETTLQLALQAVEAEPESASVQIALSYAYQANFTLPEALAAARKATEIDPESALAWARSAELWMSQGYLDEALESAHRAEALNPREVRYQTVLGFAYLTRMRAAEAHRVFEQAVQLNSADPLPRLGLGLAKIRQGDLAGGRQDIEIAAALDPINALIRSYLGKAYYEEKRNGKAAIQLDLAKQLDPNDPTPYEYDAVRKHTSNRPVEAAKDFETATSLNDNRAAYRSRQLLDSDLAARSVSRGRTYQTLGFEQRALVEGWQSVNTDPMNYSAYRFLADSYAVLPNSEIARQSALLVSQLLQPINRNPVQPSLSDDALVGAGSTALSTGFNEYSQLFERDGVQLLATGVGGSDDTWGDELIASGVHGPFSWSLGQYRYLTDGYRENADIDQEIYDLFVQGQVTSKLSLQAEARVNQLEHGYLTIHFDPDIYSPTYNKDIDERTYRLGAHYASTPTSNFLLSVLYQDYDENLMDLTGVTGSSNPLFGTGDLTTEVIEAQYQFDLVNASMIAGAGYSESTDDVVINTSVTIPGLGTFPVEIIDKADAHSSNAYLYSLVPLTEDLVASIAGSYEQVRRDQHDDIDEFLPKAGLIWSVTPATSLRMAGFKVLQKTTVSNQTIEPTQIAGFQQFFNDTPNTESELYGIGLDHDFSNEILFGMEYTKRDITSPVLEDPDGDGVLDEMHASSTSDQARAYLFWMPTNMISTSVEYYLDRYETDAREGVATPGRLKTTRLPFSIRYFHPGGFFAGLTSTFIDQEGNYLNSETATVDPVSTDFWIWDGLIGYRLPERRGIISIGVQNLTDHEFKMNQIFNPINEGTTDELAQIQPNRHVLAKLTLTFD